MRFLATLFIICFSLAANAQYFHLPKNHQNDPAIPDWAVEMYKENPDVSRVKEMYEAYFSSHEFVKTEHTQYYKRWVNCIKANLNGNSIQPQLAPQRGGGNSIWNYCGPEVHLAADGTETEISEQANVYCHDRSLSNPQVLFSGTESGGLYKTTDAGNSWIHVTSQLMVGGVSAVKIHPANSDIVFFSANNKIWKSIDGGTSWSISGQSSFQSLNIAAWEIVFHPTIPNMLFAATNQGLFQSIDLGLTWTEKLPNECMTVNFQPNNPDVVYTVQFEPTIGICKFYKSIDGGSTFAMYDNGWFQELPGFENVECLGGHMAVTEADPNRIYVLLTGYGTYNTGVELNGWIGTYVSYDAGETWTNPHGLIGTPYNIDTHPNLMNFSADDGTYTQIHYNTTIIASQLDADKILIGGLNLWKSEDAGATYQGVGGYIGGIAYLHVDQQEYRIYKTGPNTEEIWGSNDGGIHFSNDFMSTFTAKNRGIRAVNLWGYDQGWNEDIMVGGRYHNGNMGYLENYGPGNYLSLGGGEAPTGYVNYSDENKTYFSDIQGKVLPESVTQTPTNFSVSISPNESYWNNESSRIMFSHAYYDEAFLGRDNVLYKSNNASSFAPFYTFGTNAGAKLLWIDQSYNDHDVMYVQQRESSVSKLWRTTDTGTTWNLMALPLTQNNMVYSVGADANEVYLAFPNAAVSQRVWKTLDGGLTWTNITGSVLGSDKPWAIAYTLGTNGGVYIATSNGRVLYRNATMTDWIEYSAGLPFSTEALRLVPFYRDQKIRLASWNLGVWEAPLYEPTTMMVDFAASQRNFYCPGDAIHFVDHSVVPQGATYNWTFEDATPSTSTVKYPTVVYNNEGTFQVTLTVTYNGQSMSVTKEQYISDLPAYSGPIVEDFENAVISPTWRYFHLDASGYNWNISDQCSAYGNGTYSMKFDNYWVDAQGGRDEVWLQKTDLDPTQQIALHFDVAYAQYGGQYSDTLAVLASQDCGATWQLLYRKGGDELATAADNTEAFVPATEEWRHEVLMLDTVLNFNETTIFAFQNKGHFGNQIYVDNIQLLPSVGVAEEQVDLNWVVFPNPADVDINLKWNNEMTVEYMRVMDAQGRVMHQGNINFGNTLTLDISAWSAGLYLIELSNNTQHWVKTIEKK
ncbi:MAG: hypothetical protein RL521_296 [Bacteroidota bacterium]